MTVTLEFPVHTTVVHAGRIDVCINGKPFAPIQVDNGYTYDGQPYAKVEDAVAAVIEDWKKFALQRLFNQ